MHHQPRPRTLIVPLEEPFAPHANQLVTTCVNDPEEASKRYQAIILTTFHQLADLKNTRIQISPSDPCALDSIKFWLLPRLSDHWNAQNDRFTNDQWQIEFLSPLSPPPSRPFGILNPQCPFLSSRIINLAFYQAEIRPNHTLLIKSPSDVLALHIPSATPESPDHQEIQLPPQPIITDDRTWQQALESPLGAKIKKHYQAIP